MKNATGGTAMGVFGLDPSGDRPAFIKVECDSQDALVRFYEATEYAAVVSNAASDELGFYVPTGQLLQDDVSSNQVAGFSIDASSDLILLDLLDGPMPGTVLDSRAEANLEIRTPHGTEEFEYTLEDEWWQLQRLWNESGSYEFSFERYAQNHAPLSGILAAYSLVEEIGQAERY